MSSFRPMNRCTPSDFFSNGNRENGTGSAFWFLVSAPIGRTGDECYKLRLSTPGAGESRHGSARVVACDEALPAPGGALKIAARIGRSADVVIELLSVSNRVDPNTLLIGDRYSKHSHNACLSQLSLSGLGHDKQRPRRSASDARGSHVGCHGVSARDRGSLADSTASQASLP